MNNYKNIISVPYSQVPDLQESIKIESLVRSYISVLNGINSLKTDAFFKVPNSEKLISDLKKAGTNSMSFAILKKEKDFLHESYSYLASSRNEIKKYKEDIKVHFENKTKELENSGKTPMEVSKAIEKEIRTFVQSTATKASPQNKALLQENISEGNLVAYQSALNSPSTREKFLNNYQKQKQNIASLGVSTKNSYQVSIPSIDSDGDVVKDNNSQGDLVSSVVRRYASEGLEDLKNKAGEVYSPLASTDSVPDTITEETPLVTEETTEAPESPESTVSPMPEQSNQIPQNPSQTAKIPGKTQPQVAPAVEQPVKKIYRDGTKIFDAETGKQILDPSVLGSEYKGAVEVDKPTTPEDRASEIEKYAPEGTKADGQEYLRSGDVEILKERAKESEGKTSGQIYADAMKDTGKKEVSESGRPTRKFSKIARNEDGSIKVDDKGKPVSIDFYIPVYTGEQLAKLSEEDRNKKIEETKKEFLANGGKEEDWVNSEEFRAINDVLKIEASGDELYRAGEYASRVASTNEKIKKDAIDKARSLVGAEWEKLTEEVKQQKIEEQMKDIKVENNMGDDTNYNVSEEIILKPVDKPKTEAETPSVPASNPWANNANASQVASSTNNLLKIEKEPENTSLEKKRLAYKKVTNNRLGGEE